MSDQIPPARYDIGDMIDFVVVANDEIQHGRIDRRVYSEIKQEWHYRIVVEEDYWTSEDQIQLRRKAIENNE